MNSNIKLIINFLKSNEKNLLINQVSDEIGCFYDLVIRELSSGIGVKLVNEISEGNNDANDLFDDDKKIFIMKISNNKQIEEITKKNYQKIIFTDYKNYKKYIKKYIVINGYDFEKDVKSYIYEYCKVNNEDLLNYIISQPYFTQSEINKYRVNKSGYLIDNGIKDNNFILDIRKDIFVLKKNRYDIKKLFDFIKKEARHKKLNFLTY
tara:strand:+ start:65 stop:688 length:624 start_codon:yes stop_codon:yes gene_type:complete